MPASRPTKTAPRPRLRTGWMRYWEDTQQPLYCLLFLFPLVATYEFGALMLRPLELPDRLVAQSLMRGLLSWLGFSSFWLPGLALLVTLLLWHIFLRNKWQIDGWVLPLMLFESVILTAPLFALNKVMLQAATGSGGASWQFHVTLALGAGIYEELVFRLYLITGLMLLLDNVLHIPERFAIFIAIALAATIFALCHVEPIGAEAFRWHSFLVRLVAGAYLSLVFVGRGLGVATACHAAYNLILLSMQYGLRL